MSLLERALESWPAILLGNGIAILFLLSQAGALS